MRFVDFLRATVLLSAAGASLLAAIAILAATRNLDSAFVLYATIWWIVACGIGGWLGRRAEASPPIARLLATARTTRALPDQSPALMLVNRLWPLLTATIVGGVLGFIVPQVAAIAAGFAIIWSLAWRRQEAAVAAIEERDGVRFYLERTPFHRPIRLVRTPGFGGRYVGV